MLLFLDGFAAISGALRNSTIGSEDTFQLAVGDAWHELSELEIRMLRNSFAWLVEEEGRGNAVPHVEKQALARIRGKLLVDVVTAVYARRLKRLSDWIVDGNSRLALIKKQMEQAVSPIERERYSKELRTLEERIVVFRKERDQATEDWRLLLSP